MPPGKTTEELNNILNKGYWSAFDNGDLDEEGIPNDFDKYYTDEEERFEKIGKHLEIFSNNEYPFANWYANFEKLNAVQCYLLKATR
jgi:hypothetical protein